MSELERHLEAARGWLLLGSPEEASRELNGIKKAHRLDLQALAPRAGILQAFEKWEQLRILALYPCAEHPPDPPLLLSSALAARHLEGPEEAVGILMDIIQAFSNGPGTFDDLACREAATGNLDLARGWLKKAFRLDPGFRDKARIDPDLAMWRAELWGPGKT